MPVYVSITPGGVRALVDGVVIAEEPCEIDQCTAAFWSVLGEASHEQSVIAVRLSPPDCYPVRLPADIGDVQSALGVHAPLLLDRLVWGPPQEDGITGVVVTIARRDRIASISARFADRALPTASFTDANGVALDRRTDDRPSRGRATFAMLLAALVSVPATTAIGAWGLRQRIEPPASASAPMVEDGAFAAVATRPTLTASLVRVGRSIPGGATLFAISGREDGSIALDIDTPDPDQLREQIRATPALQGFREQGQQRAGDARYRVTYVGAGR